MFDHDAQARSLVALPEGPEQHPTPGGIGTLKVHECDHGDRSRRRSPRRIIAADRNPGGARWRRAEVGGSRARRRLAARGDRLGDGWRLDRFGLAAPCGQRRDERNQPGDETTDA